MIIEQADRLRNLVDRLLGPQLPGTRITESIHKVAERVVTLVSMELPNNVRLIRITTPACRNWRTTRIKLNRSC